MAFRNDPAIPDYVLALSHDGAGVLISGGFKYGLGSELDTLLRAAPAVTAVFLDSPGGRMGEAERVAGIIHARGLDTVVTEACLSACVIAFAAGRERLLGPYGQLGLHSPAFPGLAPADIRIMQDEFARQLLEAGFDAGFVQRGLAEPHESMWFPTHEELFAARAATGAFTGRGIPAGRTGAHDGDAIRTAMLENPILSAMQIAVPEAFDGMVARINQAMRDGLSQEALGAIVADEVATARRGNSALLMKAPDADLKAVLTLMLELHRTAYAEAGPSLCNRLAVEGTGALVGAGSTFTAIIETNGGAIFDAIGHARSAPVARTPATDADYEAVRQAMLAAGTPEDWLDAVAASDSIDPNLCRGLIAMMETLLVMQSDAGERVRAVFVSDVAAE